MAGAPLPTDERQRVSSLRALKVLDTPPEERFDRVTRVARRLFDVPIALVSLVDGDRQWFKSRMGIDAEETPREVSFCAYAILDDDVLVVPDATQDERFHANPFVTDSPEIRFYAGAPLKGPDGHNLGTLCVIGHEPRDFEEADAVVLQDLAEMVEQELKSMAMATTDDLTGLSNRRGFEAIANQTLAVCDRVGKPATMMLFDLNGFKAINDTLGHAAGDRLLVRFAQQLLAAFRDSDVIARLGGDEFGVLLSSASERDVKRPLALLASMLEETDGSSGVSFSVGAATYDPKRHETLGQLVEEADSKMYEEKRGAR